MSGMFKGGGAQAARPLPEPRVTRMPTETDPAILDAQKRTFAAARKRKGFMSTIMTDGASDVVGSSGKSLGA